MFSPSKSKVSAFVAALSCVVGCGQQGEVVASGLDASNPVYAENCKFSGPIDKDAVEIISQMTKKHQCAELSISSFGGDAVASFELVDHLNRRSVKMIADDHCFSACAQILAPLVEDLHINEDTLLVFHASFVEAYTWLSAPGREKSQAISELSSLTNDYVERLERNGGSASFVYEPLLRTQPICVVPQYSARGEPVFATVFSGWVPSKQWFEQFRGRVFTGYWPEDGNQYRNVVGRIKRENHDFGLTNFGGPVLGAEINLSSSELISRIQSINICKD